MIKKTKRSNFLQKLTLFRPFTSILAALALLGGYNLITPIDFRSIMGALSAFFVCAGGNSFNDLFDKDIDKINKPNRPLPAGLLSDTFALWASISLFGAGIFFGLLAHPYMFLITVFGSALLVVYSTWLKKYKFIGNIVIAFLVGLLFIAGPMLAGDIYGGLGVAIIAGILIWAREILKDLEEKKKEQYVLSAIIGEVGAKIVAAGLMFICALAVITAALNLPFLKSLMLYLASLTWIFGIIKINFPHQAQKFIKFGLFFIALALLISL